MKVLLERQKRDILRKVQDFSSTVYHYCSLDTFLSILKSKELWFGCMASMNDKKEQLFFIESLEKNLLEIVPEVKKEQVCAFFQQIVKTLAHEYSFSLCLSRLDDNAAQWERYADNANGICIGFNTEKLATFFVDSFIQFLPVTYDYDTRYHEHFEILSRYFLHNEFTKGFENERQIQENIIACSIAHKHGSFSTESEVRLVTLSNYFLPKQATFSYEKVNGIIKKILKVDLNSLCQECFFDFEDLINSITIGPRSQQSVYELKAYLECNGFKKLSTKIIPSECPLR